LPPSLLEGEERERNMKNFDTFLKWYNSHEDYKNLPSAIFFYMLRAYTEGHKNGYYDAITFFEEEVKKL
jgi:hypothetical protein